MNIGAAGVAGPNVLLTGVGGHAARVVLLNAQIPHRVTTTVQSADQLWLVVLQSLAPLGVTGPHRQHTPLQGQRAAMRCQTLAGDGGPVVPQAGKAAVVPPVLAKAIKAVTDRRGRSGGGLQKQFNAAEPLPLSVRCDSHELERSAEIAAVLASLETVLPFPMGFFDRLGRLVRANANAAVSSMEDPSKILDQSVADMQADLVKLRQAVAIAIASQKRLRSQAEQASSQATTWYERAELALKKGEEGLAREALTRRKTFQETATSLNAQLQSQDGQVETLKKSLVALEGKIAEAKTKKDMLKARAQAAKAQQQLQSAVGNIGTDSAMAAFERMEEKVEAMEATGQAAAELAGADLESQFAALEGGSDVDDELAALRNQLKGGPEAVALPASDDSHAVKEVKVEEVDADLEDLKRSIDKL